MEHTEIPQAPTEGIEAPRHPVEGMEVPQGPIRAPLSAGKCPMCPMQCMEHFEVAQAHLWIMWKCPTCLVECVKVPHMSQGGSASVNEKNAHTMVTY